MTDFSVMHTTERTLARARSVPTTRARLLKKPSYNVHCKKKKCDYRPPVQQSRPASRSDIIPGANPCQSRNSAQSAKNKRTPKALPRRQLR